jgi:hypothetical protein
MILFVDTDIPLARADRNRKAAPGRLDALLEDLGPYREAVQIVLTSPSLKRCPLAQLRTDFSGAGARRIEGALWHDIPPTALGRYDHIIYWLTRRHVWRLPSWLALQPDGEDWPDSRTGLLVLADPARAPAAAAQTLRGALDRHYGCDLWWGSGAAPEDAVLWRARALMVAWSVARSRWPAVLGSTASEVELRLEALLTIHAGAQPRVRAGEWFPHWVHLPQAGLRMRRPIEVFQTPGLEGIRQVVEHVWRPGSASALAG